MAGSILPPSFGGLNVDPDHPWLGLHPFAEENHSYFFGRTAEVRDIFLRVRENLLTVLYGPIQGGAGEGIQLRVCTDISCSLPFLAVSATSGARPNTEERQHHFERSLSLAILRPDTPLPKTTSGLVAKSFKASDSETPPTMARRSMLRQRNFSLASSCLSGCFSTTQYVGMGSWLNGLERSVPPRIC
jgi:hypothetical protein